MRGGRGSLGIATVGTVFEAVYGRDFAGVTSLREFAPSTLPQNRPLMVLVWLKLRKAGANLHAALSGQRVLSEKQAEALSRMLTLGCNHQVKRNPAPQDDGMEV